MTFTEIIREVEKGLLTDDIKPYSFDDWCDIKGYDIGYSHCTTTDYETMITLIAEYDLYRENFERKNNV